MSELREQLNTLVRTEAQLRELVETLNAHFINTEDALAEFACATASVRMPEATEELRTAYAEADHPDTENMEVCLAYRKDGKVHRLLLVTHLDDDENTESISITSATLRQRIEAAKMLPKLVQSLTLHTNGIINQINDALGNSHA